MNQQLTIQEGPKTEVFSPRISLPALFSGAGRLARAVVVVVVVVVVDFCVVVLECRWWLSVSEDRLVSSVVFNDFLWDHVLRRTMGDIHGS